MTDAPPSLDPVQLGAYFDLIEVTSLLRHAVEQQLREAGSATCSSSCWPGSAIPPPAAIA